MFNRLWALVQKKFPYLLPWLAFYQYLHRSVLCLILEIVFIAELSSLIEISHAKVVE
jgi:hypothetical protein